MLYLGVTPCAHLDVAALRLNDGRKKAKRDDDFIAGGRSAGKGWPSRRSTKWVGYDEYASQEEARITARLFGIELLVYVEVRSTPWRRHLTPWRRVLTPLLRVRLPLCAGQHRALSRPRRAAHEGAVGHVGTSL